MISQEISNISAHLNTLRQMNAILYDYWNDQATVTFDHDLMQPMLQQGHAFTSRAAAPSASLRQIDVQLDKLLKEATDIIGKVYAKLDIDLPNDSDFT